jgi:hypothetical protein
MKKKTQKKKEKQESYLNVIVRREKNIKKYIQLLSEICQALSTSLPSKN